MELKDIIPSAQMIMGSVFKEIEMNDEGRAKFAALYGFDGRFTFEQQDFPKMCKLMTKTLETDEYLIQAQGFISGHQREFTGRIMILVKRQQEQPDYTMQTIQLAGTGCGTIAVMEWIEAHGCPKLDHTSFKEGNLDVLMVSNYNCDTFVELDQAGKVDWKELDINGKKAYRYHEGFWWILKIDNNYYIATT